MSNTKFTPGPWEASRIKINGKEVEKTWQVGAGGYLIAGDITSGHTYGVTEEGQKANAHLIAKAPEMYEMLENACNELRQLIDEVNDQRLARVHSQTETPPDLHDMETCHLIQLLLSKARGE